HHADGMAADVLVAGVATAVAEKARHRRLRTGLQRFAKHVAGGAGTPAKFSRFDRHAVPGACAFTILAWRPRSLSRAPRYRPGSHAPGRHSGSCGKTACPRWR